MSFSLLRNGLQEIGFEMDIYSTSILIGVIFVATDCLLVYQSGSTGTTSGGPVVKAVDGKYEVVGLHRGG